MDFAAAVMGSHIAAAESSRQTFIGGNTSRVANFEQQNDDDDDDDLDAHIRQELAKKGCAAVDEILSECNSTKNNNFLCIEDIMILAARGNMVNVVAYCIEKKGADANKLIGYCSPEEMDTNNVSSGSNSSSNNNRPKAMDCLLAAIDEGAAQVVEYLLTKGGANANSVSQGDGVPALFLAAQHGHVYIIQLLLQHGAKVNACKQDSGNSALFAAAQNGNALACSVLIQRGGADLSFSQQQSQHPVPPLGIAIASGRPDIMALLLNAGASIPFSCRHIWRQVQESKQSTHFPNPRPLGPNVLYQMKSLLDQAKFCTLLEDTNTQVKEHYQRARKLEYQGRYRQALRSLVEAQTAYLQFNKYQEPDHFQPSPPAWVQLRLDGERLINYVYGCKGSDGRLSKWQRHVFYKDDLQPPKVTFASALYYAPHKKVYRWGGQVMSLHTVTQEYPLWAFDVNLKQWAIVTTTGKSPGMRTRHCAAILGSYMYVFAGSIGLQRNDSKLFSLHLDTKVWELIKVKGSPPNSRENASMCTYDGNLYIMGGEDSDNNPLDDLWQFNPDNKKWKELRPAPDSPVQKPLDRYCHGMWACRSKIFVFGGQGLVLNSTVQSYRYQSWSNLQCFDLETRHWNNIPNVGDFTWEFAEFLTLPLYRGQSEPSAILIWGGYHETTNPDSWATHHKYDAEYCNALYGDELPDYRLPYRRRLLRFDCETHTWTTLKLLDSDIIMPTALCWGAELWDESSSSSSQDDGLTHIMVGGGYGLTHDSHTVGYSPEESLLMEMMSSEMKTGDTKRWSTPEVSEQVYNVEIVDERNYCAADQALHLQGWAWQLYTTPLSRQPRADFKLVFGFPLCFRVMEFFEQDFLHPPYSNSNSNTAAASKWASIHDDDASLLGRRLVLKGLQAKPELNGKVCRCGVFDAKRQRYQVYLEPQQGVAGLVPMAIKSSNLQHADPLDANDLSPIFRDQQGQKPTPEVVASWKTLAGYTTIDTRPHNLERVYENESHESSGGVMLSDSYKGPFSAEGRAILHNVGRIVPKAQRSLALLHYSKSDIRGEAAREGHDIFTNWVRQVHERDAERSKHFQQHIVAHRKMTGWETGETKAKWLRVDVELDGIEPAITRSIVVSPLMSMHRLHHQVLAPALGRRSNAHCYAFRQCHKFAFPERGFDCAESRDHVTRHLALVNANWIGPKVSSALDGFFQPFYIGGEMADDQKIMLGDLLYQENHDDNEEMHIRYIHDFGDWWSHTLTVTKYSGDVPPDASVAHVLSGCGTCPPDDCGGMVEYVKRIRQLSGELKIKVDKEDHDAEGVEDAKFAYPLKERWWKCFNAMRQRNGFRGTLNQPMEFDLQASRYRLKEALRQRLDKPGLESLQNRMENLDGGGLMATVPSEAGGSDPKVLKKIKNPKGMCAVCGVTAALQLCSGCGQIAYCGREHQLQNWKLHKTDCKKAQAAKIQVNEQNW